VDPRQLGPNLLELPLPLAQDPRQIGVRVGGRSPALEDQPLDALRQLREPLLVLTQRTPPAGTRARASRTRPRSVS